MGVFFFYSPTCLYKSEAGASRATTFICLILPFLLTVTIIRGISASIRNDYFGAQRVAMNHDGTVTYLHSDHLGGSNVTTDASGNTIKRQVYYPFGGIRTSDTLATDYGFTGQKLDSDGLMYYGARYYDAALGRFISADTVVPSAMNPQALNRYSYVYNNPLKYKDPTGHECATADDNGTVAVCPGDKDTTKPDPPCRGILCEPPPNAPNNGYGSCEADLLACWETGQAKKVFPGQVFTLKEFLSLMQAIRNSLKDRVTKPYIKGEGLALYILLGDPSRYRNADSPLWNGGPAFPDVIVCIGTKCDKQSEINYFVQGMYAAATCEKDASNCESLDATIELVTYYKSVGYDQTPTDAVLYWTKFGYEWYMDQFKKK